VTLLRQHRAFLVVIAFAGLLFVSDVWIYKEFVRAESYFALGSRLMVEQGDWLTPHAPDELPLNKPPLTYWLIGISYKLFGANYGSARLPSVLAALLVLAIVYSLGVRLDGKRAGLISVAMLASSYLFLSFARMAMSDMLLTLCVTASLACFVIALTDQGSQSKALALLGYVALALGVLTKGPVAVALVAAPIGLELVFRFNRGDLRKLRLLPGVILFLLIGAPYFFLVYARVGAVPLRFFFFGENLQRFTGQIYGASGRPVWYELVAFFSDFAPWSLLVFVALWFRWRRRAEQESNSARVLYLWLGCAIVLFSLSSFKLDYYLLPAMPASALIIAPVIANAEKLPRFLRRTAEALLILGAVAILLITALSLKAAAALSASTAFRFLPVIVALVGIGLISVYLLRRKTWQATLVLTATMWATILTMQWALLPAFARYLPATQLASSVPAGSVLYTSWAASDWANCLAFNLPLPHRVERLIGDRNNERLLLMLKSNPKSVAVVRESEYSSLVAQDPVLKILAQAETFGHGGLSLNMIRALRRERLLLIGHARDQERVVFSTAASAR
jgi:4-amino-4-deoxy-L-arabinose transferase-like glycosyltransferase